MKRGRRKWRRKQKRTWPVPWILRVVLLPVDDVLPLLLLVLLIVLLLIPFLAVAALLLLVSLRPFPPFLLRFSPSKVPTRPSTNHLRR